MRHALRSLGYRGGPLVAAVSGGSDSVALLRLMYALKLPVEVFHLDHGARPDSAADAAFVTDLCRQLGVSCHTERVDVPALARNRRQSFEQAARDARYERLLRFDGTVATGHTMEDQAETVLMRLVRGAGSRGLGGVHPRRGRIIRPLLWVHREALRDYLRTLEQPWCEDPTNLDPTHVRNRIRHELLPLLSTYNPNVVDALCRTAEIMREDDAFLEETARGWTGPAPMPAALSRRTAASQGWHERTRPMPSPVAATLASARLMAPGITPVGPVRLEARRVATAGPSTASVVYLRPEVVDEGLLVRARQPGDWFCPSGLRGSKKVKKFFIDEKVPRHRRDSIPLLVRPPGDVVWIVGMRPDSRFLQPEGTADAWRVQMLTGDIAVGERT